MKTPTIIVLLLGICNVKSESLGSSKANNIQPDRAATDFSYDAILEMIRKVIKEGYPDAGIPQLDPYTFQFEHFNFEDDVFRIVANITDGTLTGLADFQMRKFNFKTDDRTYIIEFDVYFPSLNFSSGYYELEGSVIDVFPLAGKGVAHFEIYDFNIRSKLYLKLTDDDSGMLLDRFEDTGFSMSRIVSKTEYDNNFDGILNTMIEELLADYLNRSSRYLAATYSPYLVNALNSALFETSQ